MTLKRNFISSSFWIVVGRGSSNVVTFVIFLLLARLLGPADFGLVAFAALFIDITKTLAQVGIPQALIQRETWEDRTASTGFWLNLLIASAFGVIMAAGVGPVMAHLYSPTMGAVMSTLSAIYIIDAARATHEALLQRQFGFKVLAIRSIIATLAGGVIGVVLALLGFGVWALVVNRLSTAAIQTCIIWLSTRWRPRWTFSLEAARSLVSFGAYVGGADLLSQINARATELIIGLFLGPTSVGLYRVGSRAVNIINDAVIAPMQSSALSAFSRVSSEEAIGRIYLRVTKATALVAFPFYFGAAAIAPDFMDVVVGPAWWESGQVMTCIALVGAAYVPLFFFGPTLSAAGKPRLALRGNLIIAITNIVVAIATSHISIIAVAAGFTLRAYVTAPFVLRLLKPGVGVALRELILELAHPFIAASIMYAMLYGLRVSVLAELHPTIRLVAVALSGACIYAAYMGLIGRSHLRQVADEIRPLLGRFKRPDQAAKTNE